MNPDQWFGWAGNAAMLGWIILIFLPRRGARAWDALFVFARFVIPLAISLLYATLILTGMQGADGGFGSLAQVRALFSDDQLLLAGWVHYLAFDLFVGAWIAEQADQLRVPRLIQAVILVLTFLLGPIGLALFLLLKTWSLRPRVAS